MTRTERVLEVFATYKKKESRKGNNYTMFNPYAKSMM
jgi:hypothetical protein